VGVLFGSYAVALLLATFPLARITDRCGRRAPMLWGLGGLVFTTLAFALSHNFWLLVLARSLQGVAGAATWLPGMALLADHFPREERGKAMGIAFAGANVGFLVGPPLAGFLDQSFGPLSPFYLGIALVVLDALARVFLLKDVEPVYEPPIPWSVILRNRVVLVFAGAMVLGAGFWTLLESALPVDLHRRFGMGSGGIGLVFAVAALGHTVSSPLMGKLSDRIGRTKVLRIGLLSALVILPLPAILPWPWAVGVAMVALGVNSSFLLSPCSPAVADQVERMNSQSFASGFSVLNVAYSVGMMVGPLLGGVLVDVWGFGSALGVTGAVFACYLFATRGLSV
jgi:multidrug resistance protein